MKGQLLFRLIILLFLISFPLHISWAFSTTQPSQLEIQINTLVNNVRIEHNLVSLKLHSLLIDIARAHSQDMLAHNYIGHIDSEGNSPGQRVSNAGIKWDVVAENIYWSSGEPESKIANLAVQGWINSPEHYANMLSDTTYTGIGVINSGNEFYITQVFVKPSTTDMSKLGLVYSNTSNSTSSKSNNGFSNFVTNIFHNQTVMITLIFVFVIVAGWDANRRNKKFSRYRKRKNY